MLDKLIEKLNINSTFKFIKTDYSTRKYDLVALTCRTDFYNENLAIDVIAEKFNEYLDELFEAGICYDLVEIYKVEQIQFKDLNRYGLDCLFIQIYFKGIIY